MKPGHFYLSDSEREFGNNNGYFFGNRMKQRTDK